jgi:hypothetical protein
LQFWKQKRSNILQLWAFLAMLFLVSMNVKNR